MISIALIILTPIITVFLYWYCFTEYKPPHFKGRNQFSDLADAVKCLSTFGYHGAFLEIEQNSHNKGFAIMKYMEEEKYGLEIPILLNYWNEEDVEKIQSYCKLKNIKVFEVYPASKEDKALFFDCEANEDMVFKLSKFICLDILKLNSKDKIDYRFYHLSVYEEFPSIADHPKDWDFRRHQVYEEN